MKAAFEIVKQPTSGWKPKCSVVEDKKGKLLTKPDEVTERWRQDCEELYNPNANTSEECLEEIDLPPPEIEESPIIRSEIEEALKRLKCNKAPGTDNIPAELLKSGGDKMIEMLLKICNTTFKTGEWTTKWTESIVIPLPKKGNIKKCENNRTIGLISHHSKVLLYVLLNRMTPTIKRELDDAQAGFQQGRSTTERICNLRILSEKYLEHQKPLYHNFIDFKKAFDRVWHKALWTVKRKYNINNNIICTIMSLYDHAKSLVLVAGKRSNWFSSKVRQGCVLSPYLLNLFLEFIMTEALDSFDGDVKVNGRIVSNLRFADDIDLIASCEDELRELTERLDTTARKYGMEISGEKSQVMMTARKEVQLNEPITVSNQELKQVNCFKYFGSQIKYNLRSLTEIRSRIGIATSTLVKLDSIWKNSNITLKTKLRFMKASVLATMTYGCELWTLNAQSEKRINAFEMKCYRKILRIPYIAHRTNENVKDEIVHDNSLSLANITMHGRVPGERGRGRPRKTWLSNIQEWTNLSMTEPTRKAADRKMWKDIGQSKTVHLRPNGYGP